MKEKEYLQEMMQLIESKKIKMLILVSEDFAELIEKIAEKQDWHTTELLPENKEQFEEIFEIKKNYVVSVYNEVDQELRNTPFSKEKLKFYFNEKKYLGPQSSCIKQFFAIIRNKEKSFKETQTLQQRRDDLQGISNQARIIKNLIMQPEEILN